MIRQDTASLLTNLEICPRKAYLGAVWEPNKLRTTETLRQALNIALVARNAQDGASCWGDMAGSNVLDIAASPGIDSDAHDPYAAAMNLACLADILVTALRKPADRPWLIPDPVQNWTSGCLLSPDGAYLRRLVLVSHWGEERKQSESRSWYTLGEMAAYNLPMQLVVLVLGPQRWGKRHSHWTKALLHPANRKQLRFKRRTGTMSVAGGFKESWIEIWREDHDEINRETWLECMLKDDVLNEMCFSVPIDPLNQERRQVIQDLAERKLEAIDRMTEKPMVQLSGCDWPVPCQFRKCCHAIPEREPSQVGFVQISARIPAPLEDIRRQTERKLDPCLPVPVSPAGLPAKHS